MVSLSQALPCSLTVPAPVDLAPGLVSDPGVWPGPRSGRPYGSLKLYDDEEEEEQAEKDDEDSLELR